MRARCARRAEVVALGRDRAGLRPPPAEAGECRPSRPPLLLLSVGRTPGGDREQGDDRGTDDAWGQGRRLRCPARNPPGSVRGGRPVADRSVVVGRRGLRGRGALRTAARFRLPRGLGQAAAVGGGSAAEEGDQQDCREAENGKPQRWAGWGDGFPEGVKGWGVVRHQCSVGSRDGSRDRARSAQGVRRTGLGGRTAGKVMGSAVRLREGGVRRGPAGIANGPVDGLLDQRGRARRKGRPIRGGARLNDQNRGIDRRRGR
ncbi:hypothetical protein FHS38_005773 [Streptomyces netropsis]|uniref:Uncharacterized protein n=1 Tax=Streptomyces netropsis TaxID=55404 RepID=A0A7W7PH85_STRNE|nr:hypothetical protein [Streptomyces netropsis]